MPRGISQDRRERLKLVVVLLKDNPDLTPEEIADRLSVSEPTINRDLELLHSIGVLKFSVAL